MGTKGKGGPTGSKASESQEVSGKGPNLKAQEPVALIPGAGVDGCSRSGRLDDGVDYTMPTQIGEANFICSFFFFFLNVIIVQRETT